MRKRLLIPPISVRALLLAVFLGVSGLLLVPSPASATATCQAAGCAGKDPVAAGCTADAVMLDETNFGDHLAARVYHSPSCYASWAQVVLVGDSSLMQWGDLFVVPQLGGTEVAHGTGLLNAAGTAYTVMADAHDSVKACFNSIADDFDPSPESWQQGGQGQCTAWR